MAALTQDRATPRSFGAHNNDPVGAGVKVHAGAIVVLNAAGYAVPGSTAVGLKARGCALESIDNTAGADGDESVNSGKGTYRYANDGTVTRADIEALAYIVDDQTVANSDGAGTRSVAGTIKNVDAAGVWIEFE